MFAVSKNNPHRGGILTCAHMLPPSSQRKSSQREDFELGLCASHHLKNNPPKGRIPKRWDKNLYFLQWIVNGIIALEKQQTFKLNGHSTNSSLPSFFTAILLTQRPCGQSSVPISVMTWQES